MMKKSIFLILSYSVIAMFGSLVFSGCVKEQSTNLEIFVVDVNGYAVQGTTVTLLQHDNQAQIGASQISDINGKVEFMNLNPIVYDWIATKDCRNNYNNSYTTTNAITGNITNSYNTTISTTASITFSNYSSDPYYIYVDGVLYQTIAGNTTITEDYVPAGSHLVEVLQKSGYYSTPIDQSYRVTLACDVNATLPFPQ